MLGASDSLLLFCSLFCTSALLFSKSSKGLMCPGVSNPHSRGASGPLIVLVGLMSAWGEERERER